MVSPTTLSAGEYTLVAREQILAILDAGILTPAADSRQQAQVIF